VNLTVTAPFGVFDPHTGVCVVSFVASFIYPSGATTVQHPPVQAQLQIHHVASPMRPANESATLVVLLGQPFTILPAQGARAVEAARTFLFGGGVDESELLVAGTEVTLAATLVDVDGIPLRSLPAGMAVMLAGVPALGSSSCVSVAAMAAQVVCSYTPITPGRAALTLSVGGVSGPILRPVVVAGAVHQGASRYIVRQAGLVGLDANATPDASDVPIAVAADATGDSVSVTVEPRDRFGNLATLQNFGAVRAGFVAVATFIGPPGIADPISMPVTQASCDYQGDLILETRTLPRPRTRNSES